MNKLLSHYKVWIVVLASINLSCSENLFDELGDKTDNEALLQDVKQFMNEGSYTAAIGKCEEMPTSYLAEREPAYTCAAAYAGRCGLDMVDLVTDLEAKPAATNTLVYLMARLDSTAQRIADCEEAEDLIQSIGAASDRTENENALMVLIALHKLGLLTDSVADEVLDNELVDAGHDSCTGISDAQARQFASALLEIRDSGALSGIPGADVLGTAVSAACTAINGANAAKNFCLAASAAAMNANQLKGVRALISENSAAANFGIGDCSNGTFTVVECLTYSTCN